MRAGFSLVSLLVVAALAAYYFTSQPVLQTDTSAGYQRIEDKARTAAAQLAHNPQADVDAATAPATNAPAPAPGN
jgi:hypothetical protein